jgi:hypothetical protein
MEKTQMEASTNDKPFKQFRRGAMAVAVWKREHKGHTYYSATPSRAFTKDDGATFEYSSTFDADNIPVAVALLNQAFQFILATEAAAAQKP